MVARPVDVQISDELLPDRLLRVSSGGSAFPVTF